MSSQHPDLQISQFEAQLSAQKARISKLEAAVRALSAAQAGARKLAGAAEAARQSKALETAWPARTLFLLPTFGAVEPIQLATKPRLAVSGDVQEHYDANSGDAAPRDRRRAVLRGSYSVNGC